jgi:hypothetical protein
MRNITAKEKRDRETDRGQEAENTENVVAS